MHFLVPNEYEIKPGHEKGTQKIYINFFLTVYMLDNLSRLSCSIATLGLEPLYIIEIMFRSDIENP